MPFHRRAVLGLLSATIWPSRALGGDRAPALPKQNLPASPAAPSLAADGFTVLDGAGQWRGPRGLVREASHVLVIFHEPGAGTDQALEAIRAAYKARFRQQSVLRADSTACVSF